MNKPAQEIGAAHSVSGKRKLAFGIRTAIVPSLDPGAFPTFQTGLGGVMLGHLIVNLNTFGCTLVPEVFPQRSMRPDMGFLSEVVHQAGFPHFSIGGEGDANGFQPSGSCEEQMVGMLADAGGFPDGGSVPLAFVEIAGLAVACCLIGSGGLAGSGKSLLGSIDAASLFCQSLSFSAPPADIQWSECRRALQ
ncbi:MAG: hypothetical protein JWL77_118 [Chthonomonadaceae bacterium]|nr:hypothetical protein [Chthonomonadaceae bacterium]